MNKTMTIRKSNFEKTLGKTQKDFLLYCAVQVYYQEHITLRKLKNHFDEDIINQAIDNKVIVPWNDGYFFKAYQYTRDNFDLPKMISDVNKNIEKEEHKKAKIEDKKAEMERICNMSIDDGLF